MAVEIVSERDRRAKAEGGSLLAIEGVTLRYGGGAAIHPVLEGLDLHVDAGEFVAVFGPSGAGKSTLLRVVAGLVPPSSGSVTFNRRHLGSARPFGFVFQEPRLLPWRRVAHNVELGMEGTKLDRAERRRRAQESLALVGLERQGERWPRQLSGGQRQRVGIARALAVEPDILLMDEPFSSLDPVTRRRLQNELLRIWKATATSILFVTHDLEEALLLADRLVLLAGAPARILREYPIDRARPRDCTAGPLRSLLEEVGSDLQAASAETTGRA